MHVNNMTINQRSKK